MNADIKLVIESIPRLTPRRSFFGKAAQTTFALLAGAASGTFFGPSVVEAATCCNACFNNGQPTCCTCSQCNCGTCNSAVCAKFYGYWPNQIGCWSCLTNGKTYNCCDCDCNHNGTCSCTCCGDICCP